MKKIRKVLMTLTVMAVMVFGITCITMAADTVTPTRSITGYESAVTNTYQYTYYNKVINNTNNKMDYGIIIPIQINDAGNLELELNKIQLDKSLYINLYKDAACTNPVVSYDRILLSSDNNLKVYIPVDTVGTYYLKVRTSNYSASRYFINKFNLSLRNFPKAQRTIKSGQTIKYYRNDAKDKYTFKYKAEKTGTVEVICPWKYGSYVTFKNSKKKDIATDKWTSRQIGNFKAIFAVKKGQTYYFVVKSNGMDSKELQSISVKNTAIKLKNNSKKKKATTIKNKKTVKCLITPGDKKSKWFKINVKKNYRAEFTVKGDITGNWKVQLYTKSGKAVKNCSVKWKDYPRSIRGFGLRGTYYVKVKGSSANASGLVKIKYTQEK